MRPTANTMSNQLDKPRKKTSKKIKPTTPAKSHAPAVEVVTPVQRKKVDDACPIIAEIIKNTVAKGLLEVGQYLFKEFFENDPELVRSRSSEKKMTFRLLAARCNTEALPMSRSWLNHSVGLAVVAHGLDGSSEAYDRLSHTHQIRLLPLKDHPEDVKRLAQKVLDDKLTTRQLQEQVSKEVAKKRKGNGASEPNGKNKENREAAELMEELSLRLLAKPGEVMGVKVEVSSDFVRATIKEVLEERSMEPELLEPLVNVVESNIYALDAQIPARAMEWLKDNLASVETVKATKESLETATA